MKTLKRILIALLSILFVFSAAACNNSGNGGNNGGGNSGGGGNTPVTPVVHDEGDTTLASFDSYAEGFQLMRIKDSFGKISMCKEADLTPELEDAGFEKGFAKLQPLGGYLSSTTPFCYYPFKSQLFDFDYTDLSYLNSVKVNIYNASSSIQNMTMGLVMGVTSVDNVTKCNNAKKIQLNPGKNSITYLIDVSVLGILYDVTDAQGVYFQFERVGSRDIADAPVLYMDNLVLNYGSVKKEPTIKMQLETNEICTFEKVWQKYVTSVECENPACEPELSVVSFKDVGVQPLENDNKKALKMTLNPGSTSWGSWQRLVFPETLMQASDLTDVEEDDFSRTYFSFDVYGVSGNPITLYPEFFDTNYSVCFNSWAVTVLPEQWFRWELPLSDLIVNNGKTSARLSMVTSPGFFRLAWPEFTTAQCDEDGHIVILLDNLRIVQK